MNLQHCKMHQLNKYYFLLKNPKKKDVFMKKLLKNYLQKLDCMI